MPAPDDTSLAVVAGPARAAACAARRATATVEHSRWRPGLGPTGDGTRRATGDGARTAPRVRGVRVHSVHRPTYSARGRGRDTVHRFRWVAADAGRTPQWLAHAAPQPVGALLDVVRPVRAGDHEPGAGAGAGRSRALTSTPELTIALIVNLELTHDGTCPDDRNSSARRPHLGRRAGPRRPAGPGRRRRDRRRRPRRDRATTSSATSSTGRGAPGRRGPTSGAAWG